MIHAAAPHFLWPFAVRYAAHQLNLWPCVSLPETSPTLRWTRKVGDTSVFRVWGSRAFVRDTSAHKLSARAFPCVFLPTSRRSLLSQDITFDEWVPFYHLFPYRSAPLPPPPLFLAPGPPSVDPLPPQGPAPSGAARGATFGGAAFGGAEPASAEPGSAEPAGAESEGAGSGGAEPGGEELGGTEPVGAERGGAEPGGAESEGAESGVAKPDGSLSHGGPPGALPDGFLGAPAFRVALLELEVLHELELEALELEQLELLEPLVLEVLVLEVLELLELELLHELELEALELELLELEVLQELELETPELEALALGMLVLLSQPLLQPASPLPAPSPYTEHTGGLAEHHEPVSHPASPVPGTHHMALRPSSIPQRVPLPSPPTSSLADGPDPESDLARAASPTVPHLLATVVTDPSFESAAASALVTELVDVVAVCRLDYATALVAESGSACPPSVGGECALGTDVLEDRQEDFECLAAAVPSLMAMLLAPEGDPDAPDIPTPRSYAEAITGPYSSQWQTAMDAEMESWKSTGTYVHAVPPSGANIVDGMWIFRVKRLPGSPPAFKARYVARGFSQRQGRDYELHSLDFNTAFLRGSLHEEIWLRHPPCFTGSFLAGTQWSLQRPVLQCFGFRYSSPQSTPLPTSHSLSAPPSDESVEPSGPYPELVGFLMYLMTCTLPDLAYPLSILACYVAPGRHRPEHWEAAKRVLRYLCSTLGMGLVLGGRGPVVLTGHADASWVDDLATQRSSLGYTFSLGSGSVS
ncbi:unnamed protein product [Closterium sp. NIES-53]